MDGAEAPLCVESAGQQYELMTLKDFKKFKELALSDDPAWYTHLQDGTITVQSKPSDGSTSLKVIRVRREMKNVAPIDLYNNLHDARYRETWDTNMIEGTNIVQLNPHNDIGYYAAKFPWPLTNRDFCNMRSWMEFTNGDYIIFNHSVPHASCPEKKGFIRAKSILTGYLIQEYNGGALLTYVTQSDPCGSIPHSIINFTMTKAVPVLMNKCEKCSEEYPEFAAKTYPPGYVLPWRTPKMSWDSTQPFPTAEPQPEKQGATAAGDTEALPAQSSLSSPGAAEDGPSSPSRGETSGAADASSEKLKTQLSEMRIKLLVAQQGGGGDIPSLAPVAAAHADDPPAIQRYRAIMQDSLDAIDRLYVQQGQVPTTKEYLTRLHYFIEGIRRTTPEHQ